MQIKTGIDIIEVERIKNSIDELGDAFLNRVFTENEIKGNLKSRLAIISKHSSAKNMIIICQ